MRKILVTGCSTGFGQDIAKRLLEDPDNFVIVTMRNAEGRDHAFKEDIKNFKKLKVLSLDITDKAQRDAVAEYIKSEHGELNVLINNAGLGHYGALERTSEQELRDQMEINFFATSFMIQTFLPLIRNAQGVKKIINISSMLGQVGMPLSSSYSASKHALEGLVEALHYELAPFNIDVTTVCPGRHRTNFMKNISWSSLPAPVQDEKEVYQAQEENLKKMMAKFADSKEIPLSNVSKRVIKLINAKSTPSRVYVGSDAVSFYFLRKALPFNLLMKLFKAAYRKLILKRMSHANV